MKTLIRIVFVIFIANEIDCLGRVCDNCCDCFKDKKEDDKKEKIKGNEEIKEYEEIKDEGNITAKSLVNDAWYNAKENKPILKIFKKKDNNYFSSKDNGDKISIEFDEKGNPKIADQNEAENKLKLNGKKYAFFEIKTNTDKTVYLYCSDVESSKYNYGVYGIFENIAHISISVIACDTEKVANMMHMFTSCKNLIELDLKNFNTENVTNMEGMFYRCSRLENLNLNNFNTTNVTEMGRMFYECKSLKELGIKNFNTKNVTDMGHMFFSCINLKELNLQNFNTTNVENIVCMFCNCSSLTKLDIRKFNTTNVKDMEFMFYGCSKLENLGIGTDFNTKNVKDIERMVGNCNEDIKNKIINGVI